MTCAGVQVGGCTRHDTRPGPLQQTVRLRSECLSTLPVAGLPVLMGNSNDLNLLAVDAVDNGKRVGSHDELPHAFLCLLRPLGMPCDELERSRQLGEEAGGSVGRALLVPQASRSSLRNRGRMKDESTRRHSESRRSDASLHPTGPVSPLTRQSPQAGGRSPDPTPPQRLRSPQPRGSGRERPRFPRAHPQEAEVPDPEAP